MSKIVMGAFAALFLSAGCATDPYLQDSATGASGHRRAGDPHGGRPAQRDHGGQPHRSRKPRELRIVKSMSRRGYEENRMEKPPAGPLNGGG
jgi:hypothetical protein